MSGTVTAEAPVTVTEEEVRDCIASFVGEHQQVPPMYSALKVNGKKLYELAREGIVIERKARTVHFYEISILEVKLPLVRMEVTCSKERISVPCATISAKNWAATDVWSS